MAIRGTEWFSAAAQDPSKNQQAVELIRKYFQENQQALDDTAENITSLICRNKIEGKAIWNVLFELAQDVPTTHSCIVDLLRDVLLWSDGAQSANALSKLKSGFHTAWRDMHGDPKASAGQIKSIQEPFVKPWINFNVFTSLCIPAGIIDSSWGLEHVVEALETDIANTEMPPHREVGLIIAEKYLINCADYFLQYPPKDTDDGTCNTSWGWDTEIRKPDEGLTQDRWNYWCLELLNLRQAENLSLELAGGSMYASLMMTQASKYKDW